MAERNQIGAIIQRARRRIIGNETLASFVLAACLAVGGAIVILLVGTQLLDWGWLVLLTVSGLAAGLYRMWRRLPSRYRVAQVVDRELNLQDTLSTALFFHDGEAVATRGRYSTQDVLEAQRHSAERIAERIDPADAVPLAMPKSAYILAALGLVATALFAVRYGIEHSLEVRVSMAEVLYDAFGNRYDRAALPRKTPPGQKTRQSPDPVPVNMTVDDLSQDGKGDLDTAPDSVLDTVSVPDVNPDMKGKQNRERRAGGKSGNQEGEGDPLPGEQGEASDTRNGEDGQQNTANQKGPATSEGENSKGGDPNDSPADNSSLASKLRDAMSNLMSRLTPQSGSKQSQPGGSSQKEGMKSLQQASAAQKGAKGGQSQQGGEQQGESPNSEGGEDGQGQENPDGRSSGESNSDSASKSPGSGMGKQDGAKDIKAAQQLEAMGKISEIIGKRSANVTGELSVEVQSTKQQIRTPYSNSQTEHGQAGGEIHRDEVPEAFQHYVQQYFEKIRPARAAEPAKPAPQPPAPSDRSGR